jgi:hypothetical protein
MATEYDQTKIQRFLHAAKNCGLVFVGLIIILVLGVLLGIGIAYVTGVPLP